MELIELENVGYSYGEGRPALRNIDMSIRQGQRVAILGPNGAGKSTLFHLLNGLIAPESGTVTVDGLGVRRENLRLIRAAVGLVFQDPDDQLFNSTVRQEIAYGLVNMRVEGKELKESVDWALDRVGMKGFDDRSPQSLSGGEKKRIAIASVLAMKPKILVLDEPTAALDPRGASRLIELLNAIHRELGMTLLFATHDVDSVPLLADHVYLLSEGEIVLGGTTGEVFKRKDILRRIDLRLPRVAHLAELLAHDGFMAKGDLPLTIGGAKSAIEDREIVPSSRSHHE